MQDSAIDYDGYYLLILTEMRSNATEEIQRIFHDCWHMHLVNVYVLAPHDNHITLYTYFPFSEHQCMAVEPIVVNHYRNGTFIAKLNVFANKFENMHKCNLFVALSDYMPFTALHEADSHGHVALAGIEGKLLNEVARALNFSIVPVHIPPTIGYGRFILEMVG